MEFNIALHTIFYISVFIIPGILLRRFYFSGEFNKEFSQGNLMERFMWTIFSSIIVLLLSSSFFFLIRELYGKELLSAISYETIKEIFDLLSDNDLPTSTQFFAIYKDFLILLMGIYVAAIIIGIIAKNLAISSFVISSFPVFRYKNYWYYFVRGKVKSASKDKNKEYWYTEADILVEHEGASKMYSGKISDYYIDPVCNQLESIFLEDARRYKFQGSGDFELIPISGDLFCIPFSKVLNINLTYVSKEKSISWYRKTFWWLNELFYGFGSLTIFSSLWIENFPALGFESLKYKFLFAINLWLILSLVRIILRKYVFPDVYKKTALRPLGILIIFLGIQFIWILGLFGFWWTILGSVLIFIALANSFIKIKKEIPNDDKE